MKILIALFVIAVVMLMEGFGIWMLLGINEHEPTSRGKLFWLAVVTATQWLGGLAYCTYRALRPISGRSFFSRSNAARLKRGLHPHVGRV
jgi:hypothetical protein